MTSPRPTAADELAALEELRGVVDECFAALRAAYPDFPTPEGWATSSSARLAADAASMLPREPVDEDDGDDAAALDDLRAMVIAFVVTIWCQDARYGFRDACGPLLGALVLLVPGVPHARVMALLTASSRRQAMRRLTRMLGPRTFYAPHEVEEVARCLATTPDAHAPVLGFLIGAMLHEMLNRVADAA